MLKIGSIIATFQMKLGFYYIQINRDFAKSWSQRPKFEYKTQNQEFIRTLQSLSYQLAQVPCAEGCIFDHYLTARDWQSVDFR